MNTFAQLILTLLDASNARAYAATGNVHHLKCWPQFYEQVENGTKPFEIRRNDRGYQIGDTLLIKEYHLMSGTYSGRECRKRVTYLTDWEQRPGYVVLGIEPELPRANEAIAVLVEAMAFYAQYGHRANAALTRAHAILKGE